MLRVDPGGSFVNYDAPIGPHARLLDADGPNQTAAASSGRSSAVRSLRDPRRRQDSAGICENTSNVDNEERFARVLGKKRGTGSRVQPAGPPGSVGAPSKRIYARQLGALAFPERHGPAILLFAGVLAWLGAVAATIGGHEAVAVTALTTGAGMIGAAAYYSRVRKLPGVELAEVVLDAGGTYEAPPGSTPTEAVQDFTLKFASTVTGVRRTADNPPALVDRSYFLHVDAQVPRGMAARAAHEVILDFADYLRSHGWEIQREVTDQDHRRIDLVAVHDDEQLWVEVKPVVYALNQAIIREIAEHFPKPTDTTAKVRRALLLPVPPLVVSPEAIADFREKQLELWYADARVPQGFVRAA